MSVVHSFATMASPSAEFIHAALRSLSNRIESVNQTWQGDDVQIRHQQEALRSELGRLQVPHSPAVFPGCPSSLLGMC